MEDYETAATTIASYNESSTTGSVDYCTDFWMLGATNVSDTVELIRYMHLAVITPPIAVLGMLGNLALLFVLSQSNFKTPTYRYIFWLALADLGTLTFGVLYMLTTTERFYRQFGFVISWVSCHILFPTINTFGTWSAFMVVTLTVHRLRAVWNPFAFRTRTVKTHVVASIMLLLSVLINLAGFLQYALLRVTAGTPEQTSREVRCYRCTWSAFHIQPAVEQGYVLVRELFTRVLTVAAVFLLNIAIIIVYRHRRAQGRFLRSHSDQSDVEERRVIFMLLFICTTYVVCVSPMSFLVVTLSTVRKDTTSTGYEYFRATARVLIYVQSSCNFYLYFFCSPAVRKEFKRLCSQSLLTLTASCRRKRENSKSSEANASAKHEMTAF